MFFLLPRIVGKLCIVSSVEYLKDEKIIDEVIKERESEQLTEALQVIALVRLRGLIDRGKVTAENRAKALKQFRLQSEERRAEVREVFKYMDLDGNGTVNVNELSENLKLIGLKEEHVVALFELLDQDKSGLLSEEEFEGLIALSMMHKSKREEAEDFETFFELFDKIHTGSVQVEEMSMVFSSIGSAVSESFIAGTVFECFRKLKSELDREEFTRWLQYLHEKYSHGAKDIDLDEIDRRETQDLENSAASTLQKFIRKQTSRAMDQVIDAKDQVMDVVTV
jgi:Ca2+-binding EF-hand superfamily protein